MTLLSGYILARQGAKKITRDELTLRVKDHSGEFSMQFDKTSGLGKSWESFRFTSSTALPNDNIGPNADPVHTCQVLICRSRSRMLFLTERRKFADFVIDNLLSVALFPNFRKVPIAIDQFIGVCSSKESPYAVTSMHGRFSGTERFLRTIILYGDEVTDSSLFRQQRALFNFYSAGVRKRTSERPYRNHPYDDPEIARVGNDGLLSANFRDEDRADEVLRVVKYLFDNGWAENWTKGE